MYQVKTKEISRAKDDDEVDGKGVRSSRKARKIRAGG